MDIFDDPSTIDVRCVTVFYERESEINHVFDQRRRNGRDYFRLKAPPRGTKGREGEGVMISRVRLATSVTV